jgi:hypothetical protein
MMRTRKLVPYCLVVLLAGCVPLLSLHPLYTEETITFEEKLLGTWLFDPNAPESRLEFARLEEDAVEWLPVGLRDQGAKCYRVSLIDGKGKGSVVASPVKLQDRLFLDVMPAQLPGGEQDPEGAHLQLNAMLLVPVHTFVQVSFSGDQLKLGLTWEDEFRKLLKAEPKAVKYTMVKEHPIVIKVETAAAEHPLLVASTEELQAFVIKYADDERLFLEGKPLTRKPSTPVQ